MQGWHSYTGTTTLSAGFSPPSPELIPLDITVLLFGVPGDIDEAQLIPKYGPVQVQIVKIR
jgi:hypothetical protein